MSYQMNGASNDQRGFRKDRKDDKMNLPMDYAIRSNKVRVISESGETRIMNKDDAVAEAKSQNKNLVQISFNPSVFPGSICKILDYAKFKYDQKKKQKEQNKKARANRADLKELSFTIRIDDGDRATKIKHAKEFLADGDNVKLSIFMSKREMSRLDLAKTLLSEILNEFTDIAKIDKAPSLDGRNWTCIISKVKPGTMKPGEHVGINKDSSNKDSQNGRMTISVS